MEKLNVICWSGGKDSTATIILAKEHGIPIDKILFAEVMFSHKDNISGEMPEHIDWVKNVAIPTFIQWGYSVDVLHANEDYLSLFFKKSKGIKTPARKGKYYGWLWGRGCWANSACKKKPIHDYLKPYKNDQVIQIVGIAIDEPKRLERAKSKGQRSLLAEFNYTEEMAKELCKQYNLLSPLYDNEIKRGGCWFCPNGTIAEYTRTKIKHPELWELLMELNNYYKTHTEEFAMGDNMTFTYNKSFEELDKKVDDYIKERSTELWIPN